MALFEVTPFDRKVYEEQLRDFLPEKILDVHAHVWLDRYRKQPWLENGVLRHTITKWTARVAVEDSIEDLQETYARMFPGKDVRALIFANDFTEENSDYVARVCKSTGWPGLYYSKPHQSADEVEQKIRSGGFVGIKSYLSLSPSYIPTREVRIFDFFPKHQLERMNEMGAIVMLHIPRDGRLKDPVNLYQILELRQQFPNVRLIVAHIGRAYTPEDIGDAFSILDQIPDTMYDFSANCSDTAISQVLQHAGAKHVMFGTDMPILRMRAKRITENGTYINLVPPGLYGDTSADPHLREVSKEEGEEITFFAYEELLAFKRVAESLGLSRQDVEDVMYNNAVKLIADAHHSIYG